MERRFYRPTFVTDCSGGGGKRVSCSYEYYNRETGVSTYVAPSIKKNRVFFYFDPLSDFKEEIQEAWLDPKQAEQFCDEALDQIQEISVA